MSPIIRLVIIVCVVCSGAATQATFAAVRIFETKPIPAQRAALTFQREGAALPIFCSWPPLGAKGVRLDSNTIFKFTVFDGGAFDSHILKVQSGDTTLFDKAECEVHSLKMELKRVPIIYGLLRRDDYGLGYKKFNELERTRFPNSQEFLGGGCVVTPTDPKNGHVWFCKQCKRSFEEWKASSSPPVP